MKSTILYIALCVLFVDFINAKSIKFDLLRERRADKPKPKPKTAPAAAKKPGPAPGPRPGLMAPPMPGQMPRPMPGQMPGQMQGAGALGGPGCGGCAQPQGPKQCPAVCMRWSTIIKPNGQVENGPSSITPLSPNEKVGPNGVFPPMNSFSPMMPPQFMPPQFMPPQMMPGFPSPGIPNLGTPPGGQPPQGPPPAAQGTTAPPKKPGRH